MQRLVGLKLHVSAAQFLTERLIPEASRRLAFKNVHAASVFAKWMTDDNMRERVAEEGENINRSGWQVRRVGQRYNDVEERQSNKRWGREMSIQLKVCFQSWLWLVTVTTLCSSLADRREEQGERAGWLFTGRFAKWIRAPSLSRSIFLTRPLYKIRWP